MQVGKLYRLKVILHFVVSGPDAIDEVYRLFSTGTVLLYLGQTYYSSASKGWWWTWLSPDGEVVGRWFEDKGDPQALFDLCK